MSCLTFVQSANEIWMASDRALVSQIDGKWIRLRSDYSKLFIFNSCAYFICGDISASNILKELVLGGYSNEYISNYAREHNYAVEIVCSRLLDGEIITDNYSFLNNFKKNTIVCNYVGAFSIGIETERATNLLEKCYNEFNSNPLNYFKHVYNELCEQRIGGSLDIIHISSNGIEMLYSDLDDPYYSNKDTGLVAGDALVGKILAGTTLQITTGDKSFTIDEKGAVLNNARFEITTDSGKAKIILSPKDGIRVQQISGGRYIDKFYVDTDGNAVFSGKITANEGSIGGWLIDSSGLYKGNNYIKSDGTLKIGILTLTKNGGSFDGDIWAANLQDHIQTDNIANQAVTGGKIANLTITDSNIKGGTITGAKIASSTITGSHIADSTITDGNIKGGTITGAKIADVTITGAKIADATINFAKIDNAFIENLNAKYVSTSKIYSSKGILFIYSESGDITIQAGDRGNGIVQMAAASFNAGGSNLDSLHVKGDTELSGSFKFGGNKLSYSAYLEGDDGSTWQCIGVKIR